MDWLILLDEGGTLLQNIGNHQPLKTRCLTAVLCDLKCHKMGSILAWTLTIFYWSDQVIEDVVGGACSMRSAYKIIVGRPKGKASFGRCSWRLMLKWI